VKGLSFPPKMLNSYHLSMTNENDTQEVQPEENEQEEVTPEEQPNEDLEALKKTVEEQQKQIADLARAKRELKKEVKKVETEETPQQDITNKPDEPDYAKLAFLNSQKVTHPDDQKIIMDEAQRLKLPLTDVLGMEHMKTKLKESLDEREAKSGTPKGKGSRGSTVHDVDYHLAKGTTPDDVDEAEKVIDARMKKDESNQMFDPIRA